MHRLEDRNHVATINKDKYEVVLEQERTSEERSLIGDEFEIKAVPNISVESVRIILFHFS